MPDTLLADLKLQIDGLVPPDKLFHRLVLFEGLYASFPKDPQAKVQIYTAKIVPKGWTNYHCHNGATFFLALQGVFEAIEMAFLSVPRRVTFIRNQLEDASRPQSARYNSLPVRGVLHYRAGPRSHNQPVILGCKSGRFENSTGHDPGCLTMVSGAFLREVCKAELFRAMSCVAAHFAR